MPVERPTHFTSVTDNVMEQNLSAIDLHQIFVESPDGVWIELNFKLDDYLSKPWI